MRRLLRSLFCLSLSLAWAGPSFSQATQPPEWGSVDPADLALRFYPSDPSVPALVLSDYQVVGYYVNNSGIQLRAQRHRRVKYFESYAYAKDPGRIEWYRPTERISQLRGLLHLPNGRVIKLRKRDFRSEPLGEDWSQYVLEIPEVPVGSILEYSYLFTSDNFDQLPAWYFQEQYPVRRSEYRATVPDWFDYVPLAYPDSSVLTSTRIGQSRAILPFFGGLSRSYTILNDLELVAESLPAIPQERYTSNTFDHVPQLRMRLRSITWPGEPTQPLYPTWAELADSLRTDNLFGRRYLDPGQIDTVRRALAPALATATQPAERGRLAYRAIADHLTWDGTYRSWSDRSPDAVWTAGSGSSGELNLLLLAVLRDLDIVAFPVLVSTRGNGVPTEELALRDQFDHVLVLAQLGDRALSLDVDGGYRPVGLPRPAALNNRGWLVLDDTQQWVDLRVPPSEQTVVAELTLDTTGTARGRLSADLSGYYAAFARERLQRASASDPGPLLGILSDLYPGAEFERTVVRPDSDTASLRIALEGSLPLVRHDASNRMYIVPVLLPSLSPDLLTAAPRQFPLDMPFPWTEQYRLVLELPPGYAAEALPEAVQLRSPDDGVSLAYSCSQQGRQLRVAFTLALRKTYYSATEYEASLRDLFLAAIDRQEAAIVLRRQ